MRDIVKTAVIFVHFAIQDGGPKSFPFKWKHWFLVSERSQLSKKCIWLQLSTKFERKYIATLTIARITTVHKDIKLKRKDNTILSMCISPVRKDMFLYSAVSSQLDRSKRRTLHPLADLFIPTPIRLLREAF